MSQGLNSTDLSFVDRRSSDVSAQTPIGERRQFANRHEDLSPDARELATALDQYKITHRRRFVNYEEMLSVIQSLGYHKG